MDIDKKKVSLGLLAGAGLGALMGAKKNTPVETAALGAGLGAVLGWAANEVLDQFDTNTSSKNTPANGGEEQAKNPGEEQKA